MEQQPAETGMNLNGSLSGDAAFGDMSRMMMNVVNYYDKVAEVRCPECGKTGFVDL